MKTSKTEKTRDVDSLKGARKNPRRISDSKREALKASILQFGDLSGVIRNVRTDELVGANQRVSIFREVGGQVVITERLKKPDKRGTVARGHVLVDGEKFSYREVNWPLPRQRAANLAANKHGGEFIDEQVKEILAELSADDRALAGFDSTELEALLGEAAAELEPVTIMPPPKMAWVLVGIPLVQFASITTHVEAIAKVPDVLIESTFNDNEQKPAEPLVTVGRRTSIGDTAKGRLCERNQN